MTRTVSYRWIAPSDAARGIVTSALLAAVALVAAGCNKDSEPSPGTSKTPPVATIGGGVTGSGAGTATPQAQIPQAKPRGPERAVYSLIDNRLAAHVQRQGGLVVVGGSAGFPKYLRFRKADLKWKTREERDGKKVAIMGGTSGGIHVPLTAAQIGGAPALRMRVHNDQARALSVRINGEQKREISYQLQPGWATVELKIPAGLLRDGDNEILFFTGAGQPMAIEWLQVGGEAFGDAALTSYARDSKSLVLPRDGGLSFYVMAPQGGRLTGDLNDATCKVAVTATAEGGGAVEGELVGNGSAVELAEVAGKPIRLDLVGKDCDQARLARAALVVSGEAPTVKRGEPPKYVVLWVMDSLRADRLRPFYPTARPEVPTFDRLAKEGAVFLQAYVQGNESRVSHASIWSALYPVKHNMIDPKAKLDARWNTIDEVAREAGLFTSGVSANGYVAMKWGFGTAWNVYRNHIHEGGGLRGQDIFDAAMKTIDGKTDPWFLYIGTIDTHVSWRPKQPWISRYHPPYKGRFADRFSGEDAGRAAKLNMTDAEIAWVRAVYDSNVSYQDDLLRQFMDKLEAWGIADQTMIIITADHGDEQWEVGRVGHGASLRESLVHVPLLIWYPRMFPGGSIPEGAEVVDILPTVADALGRPLDPEWQGETLLPLAHGVGAGYPRMSMASQYEGAHVARMGAWKLRAPGTAAPELYNIDQEYDEKTDLAATHPIARRMVSDPLWLLRAYNMGWKKSEWGNAANVKAAFPESFGE